MRAMPTPLSISVLALLNERPMHPYEMYQLLLERHEDRVVKVRPGSLYHCVERLEDHSLVEATGTERSGNRPERTTYAITSEGRHRLVSWTERVLSEPINEYPIFPVALSESHNLPKGQALRAMRSRLDRLDEQIAGLDELIDSAAQRDVPEAYWFAADYVRAMQTTEREWLRRTVTRIEGEQIPWPHASK